MAKVVVLAEYCKSCGLCLSVCPNHVLRVGQKANQKGYYVIEIANEAQCTGCTLCGIMCPDLALEIAR